MNELDSVSIRGFKSLASIEQLKLESLNVLIGPNGSGKSNFLGIFSFLHALREGRLQEYVVKAGGANRLLHFGSKITEKLEIHISFNDGVNQYEIELQPTDSDELVPTAESVFFWDKKKHARPYDVAIATRGTEAGISSHTQRDIATYVRDHLAKWRVYHFHDTSSTSPMKRAADLNDNRFLRPDGSNLPSFLFYLQQKHELSYSLIRGSVQRAAPFFQDFILEPQRLNPSKIRLEWRHRHSDEYFDASSMSDGTLRFICLSTLFLQPEELRPSVIVVDEPELGLHPYAITVLASMVRQASTVTQVIIETQSSLLLDHFEPEDVLVADRVGGATHFTRLESERLGAWLGDYSLGQLWEKNEIGGRPNAE